MRNARGVTVWNAIVFDHVTKAIRRRRALRYFRAYPEDLAAKTAKEAAEMVFVLELSDVEWQKMSARW
jgi:hypothetical protein